MSSDSQTLNVTERGIQWGVMRSMTYLALIRFHADMTDLAAFVHQRVLTPLICLSALAANVLQAA